MPTETLSQRLHLEEQLTSWKAIPPASSPLFLTSCLPLNDDGEGSREHFLLINVSLPAMHRCTAEMSVSLVAARREEVSSDIMICHWTEC